MTLGEIILLNVSHHAEQLGLAQRIADLDHVWTNRDQLPEALATLVDSHRTLTRSGQPVPEQAEKVVEQIQRAVTETAADLGILYRSEGQDALSDLLASLSEPPAAPPIAVADVDPDETEIRRRTVKEWKRWAASRGAASARFRQGRAQGLELHLRRMRPAPAIDLAQHLCGGRCSPRAPVGRLRPGSRLQRHLPLQAPPLGV
ncbi:MAG: hypothetical protein WDO73_22675 [Ignavibacteriota bacterium]